MSSRDKLHQDANQTRRNFLFNTGKTALAVGAGAVLFHREGGTRALEQGVGLAKEFLTRGAKELALTRTHPDVVNKGLGAFSRSALDGLNAAKKEALTAQSGRKFQPRMESSYRGTSNMLHERERIVGQAKGIIGGMYDEEHIIQPFLGKYKGSLADPKKGLGNLENYVREAVRTLRHNPETGTVGFEKMSRDHLSGIGLQDRSLEMLDTIAAAMKDKELAINEYTEQHSGMLEDMTKKLLNTDSLQKRFGSVKKGSFVERLLGDRPATFDEVMGLADDKKIDLSNVPTIDAARTAQSMLQEMREKSSDPEAFGQLYFDRSIRMKGGEVYSTKNLSNFMEWAQKTTGATLPGKVLRVDSWLKSRKSPLVNFLKPGEKDPVLMGRLADKALDIKDQNLTVQDHMVRVHDKVYRMGINELEHIPALDNMKLITQGTRMRLIGQMQGDVPTKPTSKNPLFRALDIGQSGQPTIFNRFSSKFTKFKDPGWIQNAANKFLGYDETDIAGMRVNAFYGQPQEHLEAIRTIDKFFSQHARPMDMSAAKLLRAAVEQQSAAKPMFEMLTMDNQNLIKELTKARRDGSKFINHDLGGLLNRYMQDPKAALDTVSTKISKAGPMEMKDQLDYFDLLRREIGKEGMLRHSASHGGDQNVIVDLLETALKGQSEAKNARLLAHWAVFQSTSNSYQNLAGEQKLDQFIETIRGTATLFHVPDAEDKAYRFSQSFRKDFQQLLKENTGAFDSFNARPSDVYEPNRYNEWIHVGRNVSPLNLLASLNNMTKMKAFGKQFTAGRHTPENITELTMAPFFFMNRMSDAMNHIGLGFSTRSTGSNQQLLGSIVGKRILPAALALTYGSYASDMTGELTGTSLTGMTANTFAHLDLGARRIGDTMGLGGAFAKEKEINPLLQYWGGREGYQDYSERKQWYEEGYSPVRKSRYWNFGSLNEFRGGQISYFQPNYLRRAHSDWKDKSLYDSKWEKWAHSPLPTPTAPFSTLRYLANPYWLEEKHTEDRPYPMTGKLFSEETPWGAVLNPTLGELIKPQRRMHQDRLGRNMFDVKLIIEERNRAQIQRAADKGRGNLIRVKDGQFEPVRFTPMGAPTDTERVFGVGGRHSPSGVSYTGQGGGVGEQVPKVSQIQGKMKLSYRTRIGLQAAEGHLIPSLIEQRMSPARQMATSGIAAANESIFNKARINEREGVVTPESVFRTQARYSQNILYNREAMADLRNINSGRDNLTDIMYSARYLSGIYGYAAHVLTPTPKEYRLANANAMTSKSRALWDESLGGMAGPAAGPFEIVRRFMTVQNRYVEHVNPLMNTMPDWMPMRYRTGDPYAGKVPKGAMRLPGRGYESLNNLHPDQFGLYGAYDRMKILADVSPFSDEYRQWRDIASRTVQDPHLRNEIQKIRQRVTDQSKANDFYPHRFLGQRLDRSEAVIDRIVDNNHFTIVGSQETYRMAGISVTQTEDGEDVLNQFLQPGMNVGLLVDQNEFYRRNEDSLNSINASVRLDGQNLNKMLLDQALAQQREDYSAAGTIGLHEDGQALRGKLYEAFAHTEIPVISNKYMRIRTPLNKYKAEHVYGTPFASWRAPLRSYLFPAMERAVSNDVNVLVGTLAWMASSQARKMDTSKSVMTGLNIATALTNRGAFIGGALGWGLKLGGSSWVRKGADIGAVATLAGYAYTRRDQPLPMALTGAAIGAGAMKLMGQSKLMPKAAGVGALLSLAVTGMQNSALVKEDRRRMLGSPYIPKRIKEKWDMQEYFDRMKYVKFSGLYEKSARRARLFEGTDIKGILREYDATKSENDEAKTKLLKQRETIERIYPAGDERAQAMMAEIDEKIQAMESSQNMYLRGGKYTRSALIYKQAMESTVFGLREDATWSHLLRSLPRNDRDYFMEFAKERDPKQRQAILEYVSPSMKRALKIAWGIGPDKQKSNRSFFQGQYRMPGPTWSGWRPGVDMDNIAAKTVYNEGMMLSDFGYYDSQLRDPDVIDAPYLAPHRPNGAIALQANLATALNGAGLFGVKVNVQPSARNGVEVIADVTRIGTYNVGQRVSSIMSQLF